ncbi:MAG: acetylglutamate kinase, partial [Candidatus Obscuribacterales bacterium]
MKLVVKIGGSTLTSPATLDTLAPQLKSLVEEGASVYIVHGAGPHISARMLETGLTPRFENGLRVTDDATLAVVKSELLAVNSEIAGVLASNGLDIEVKGPETGVFKAVKVNSENTDLGLVGEVTGVDLDGLESGKVCVIAPLGFDGDCFYNINADHAAMALAGAVKADALVFLSDVDGVLLDRNDPNSLIKQLMPGQAEELISSGSVQAGMIQKLKNSIEALTLGVRRVCITDGRRAGSLIEAALN